jgi:hypothetical protein
VEVPDGDDCEPVVLVGDGDGDRLGLGLGDWLGGGDGDGDFLEPFWAAAGAAALARTSAAIRAASDASTPRMLPDRMTRESSSRDKRDKA